MLMVGFGFLMVFVRKYGYTSITATYLAVALSLPLYMLVRPCLWGSAADLTVANISMLLFAEFAAASLLIAMGGPLGRIKTSQYLLVGALFTPLYALNEWLLFSGAVIPGRSFLGYCGVNLDSRFWSVLRVGYDYSLAFEKRKTCPLKRLREATSLRCLGVQLCGCFGHRSVQLW